MGYEAGAGRAQRAFEVRKGGASMKIELLREFVALAHYGSFRAASEKLFVSQPTLSNHIKGLSKSSASSCSTARATTS